jgi:hypothetical protein
MRSAKLLLAGLAGLAAIGVAGCSATASGPATSGPTAGSPPVSPASATPRARPASLPGAKTKAGARAAAARFDRLQVASQYAASWDLLTPTARRLVPRDVWVGVHEGCPAARPAGHRTLGRVTVFGTVAIVAERIPGTRPGRGKGENVFAYANGNWGYSPNDLSIYQHGSVAADIAAAKAAGLCASWKGF